MIKFGIIGTNWITDSFIQSAHSTSKYQLSAVYSRTKEAADSFASKYDSSKITTYTSISDLCADTTITVVYIASPNSLHFTHAHAVLEAGKHVILEKPATSTSKELDTLYALAKTKNVFLLEAFRHIHEVNFKLLERLLSPSSSSSSQLPLTGTLLGASLTYSTYSSRYDAVLAGETPNIFSLSFSGGSLVDIGVYPISFAIRLFGTPISSTYTPYICPTGVDGGGMILLTFSAKNKEGKEYTFPVQINQSKCFRSSAPSEIYTENGTVTLNATTDIESVVFWDRRSKESKELAEKKAEFNLAEEAEEFARLIEEKDGKAARKLEQLSRTVISVTEKLRRENGIVFGAEREGTSG